MSWVLSTVIATELLYIMCHAQHKWTTLYSAADNQFTRPSHFCRSGCGSQDYACSNSGGHNVRKAAWTHPVSYSELVNAKFPLMPLLSCYPDYIPPSAKSSKLDGDWSLLVKWYLFFSRWNDVHFTGKTMHVLILLKVSTVTPSCCTFYTWPLETHMHS